MPAPSSTRSAALLHASALSATSSPFHSPAYTSASHVHHQPPAHPPHPHRHEEKESESDHSSTVKQPQHPQLHWRPHPSPLMLGQSTEAAYTASSGGDDTEGGEWMLSPMQSHNATPLLTSTASASSSSSARRSVPMSPLVLPLSSSPLPALSPSLRPSSSPSLSSAPSFPSHRSVSAASVASSAAAPSVSSPFASLQPSPSLRPSPSHLSPLARPRPGSSSGVSSSTSSQFNTPPSRPSASPRLSASHHQHWAAQPHNEIAGRAAAAAASTGHSHSYAHHRTHRHTRSRGSLSDVCPSPILSPITSPYIGAQHGAIMPGLSLDQLTEDSSQYEQQQQQHHKQSEQRYARHSQAPSRSRGHPDRHHADAMVGPLSGPTRSSSRSRLWSLSLPCVSWLRGSRLLLFVAVVVGVVLFQLLLTVLLLPGSTSGWSNLHQSASLAQLDRSRQSAQLFQRSHAGHSHGQHRDDEALRQAVADLQQHVILHNSRKDSSHDAQRERHAFENDGVEGASEGMASNKLVQKAREEQHAPMELVDADASWE